MRAGPLPYPMSATLRSATVAPLSVETRRLPSACRSPCSSAGQHAHGHLPVREVEARRIGIGVAHGGDARHRADRRGGDARPRRFVRARADQQFGRGSGSDLHVGEARQRAHVAFQRMRGPRGVGIRAGMIDTSRAALSPRKA